MKRTIYVVVAISLIIVLVSIIGYELGKQPPSPEATEEPEAELELQLQSKPVVGAEISILVTTEGSPVEGAVISLNAEEVGETGADGCLFLRMPYTLGEVRVQATLGDRSAELNINLEDIPLPLQTIAVLVDENTYQQLKSEIERYVKDIENDSNANVFLYHRNWQSPQEVRNQLLSLKDEDLKGAVLIGEIPAAYFETTWCKLRPGFFSDRYYMDLENKFFTDEDDDGKFELENYNVKENLMKLIWLGRIKPPIGGMDGINLLKNYFERNHQYRTGKIAPSKKLVVYSPDIDSGPSGATLEIYLHNLYDFLTLDGSSDVLYDSSEIDILVGSSREEYLEVLQNDYEILALHAHGTQLIQVLGDGTISYEDIKVAQPKPYFCFLYSCSNGDFTEQNYIGGHYLFNGNALVVYAPSAPTMAGAGEIREYIQPLALGHTFGETIVFEPSNRITSLGLPQVILGDPTLSIRPKIGVPRIEVDTTEVDFGEVVAVKDEGLSLAAFEEALERRTITIKNIGTGKLILNPGLFYLEKENGAQGGESVGYREEPVPPGESATIEFVFWPKEKGSYTGLATIHTNDPVNPIIIIILRGRGI